jgi:hypothetical protein
MKARPSFAVNERENVEREGERRRERASVRLVIDGWKIAVSNKLRH